MVVTRRQRGRGESAARPATERPANRQSSRTVTTSASSKNTVPSTAKPATRRTSRAVRHRRASAAAADIFSSTTPPSASPAPNLISPPLTRSRAHRRNAQSKSQEKEKDEDAALFSIESGDEEDAAAASSSDDCPRGDVIALLQDDHQTAASVSSSSEEEEEEEDDMEYGEKADSSSSADSGSEEDDSHAESPDLEEDDEEEDDEEEDMDAMLQRVTCSFVGGLDRIVRERQTDERGLAAPKHNIELESKMLKTNHRVDLESMHTENAMQEASLPKLEGAEKLPARLTYHARNRRRKEEESRTAGDKWYGLPRGEVTDDVKRDMKILYMRSYIHKNRFYKKATTKKVPAYFQVGTVVAGAADRYHQLSKRERKSTLVGELLGDRTFRDWTKRKYSENQRKATSGRFRNRSQQNKKHRRR